MNSILSDLRKIVMWIVLALLLMGMGLTWFLQNLKGRTRPEGSILAVYGKAPLFSLTERSGRAFSGTELLGKPWIADFIFTSCAGQCPLMSLKMQKLQKDFSRGSGLQFVSFTVDPGRDTPEVLSQYADRYNAEKDRWFFLTGPKEEANRLLKEFFLSPVEEPAMHSIRFILVDREGQIRGYYDSSDDRSMKQLAYDAELLIRTLPSPLEGERGWGEG